MAGREERGGTNGKVRREHRPVDRRVARSRRAIRAAFERLVMERPLDDITVSAIAREADVDRKTFYQHFGSVDGLLDEMALDVVARVLDDAEAAYCERDADCALAAFFSGLARALSENLALNRRLLESVPPERLLGHLADPLAHGIRERGLVSPEMDAQTFDYCLAFELGGLVAALRAWALAGEGAPPVEDVTRVAQELTSVGIRGFGQPDPTV
ncbi:MAG TPA: TetR/AcrR family transcriptional regulator [Olsenella sp.]|nr:TetR/AcrR family transcriptional regulator [Olsenella sp.]